ncbi:MAG: AAA family ATPase, partial [Pseudomonadota bacterium]
MEINGTKKTYPAWVRNFVRKYHSRTISQYLLHGNIHDYVSVQDGERASYLLLREFLSNELFDKGDIVVFYDRSSGIRFKTREMKVDFLRSLEAYDTLNGTAFAKSVPRDPVRAFTLLEMHFRKRLMGNGQLSIAFIVEYAETLIPMGNAQHYNPEDRAIQVFLQRWANEGLFRRHDMIIVLLTENIINLNQQYVRNPYTYEITLPYPDEAARLVYIQHFLQKYQREGARDPRELLEMPDAVFFASTASGISNNSRGS